MEKKEKLISDAARAVELFGEDALEAYAKNIPDYCTQNGGDCSTCSLVNYGRDCRNVPV